MNSYLDWPGVGEEHETFRVEGVGCWCEGTATLYQLRSMGHTRKCIQARRGWEANYRHLRALDEERRSS